VHGDPPGGEITQRVHALAADADVWGVVHGDDILVVDDDPKGIVAIEAALGDIDRTIVSATSGAEALAKLLEQDFALILLDVAMPDMTGIETARLIRARERNRDTPILFVTGLGDAIEDAYDAGAFDFLIKPIPPRVLQSKVRLYLALQERTRALHYTLDELRASDARHRTELHEERRLRREAEERLRNLTRQVESLLSAGTLHP
jgi:CheY-like chemotaxis protein